jgi:hypothetical protein
MGFVCQARKPLVLDGIFHAHKSQNAVDKDLVTFYFFKSVL